MARGARSGLRESSFLSELHNSATGVNTENTVDLDDVLFDGA